MREGLQGSTLGGYALCHPD